MKIDCVTRNDLEEIFAISREQFLSHSWQMNLFEDELEHTNHYALVGRVNNEIVCFVCYMITEGENGVEYNILNIATKKGYENNGYATELLSFIKNNAKENGYSGLWLEVRETNLRAIKFYKNFGFKKLYIRKKYYSNGDNAIIMSLCI